MEDASFTPLHVRVVGRRVDDSGSAEGAGGDGGDGANGDSGMEWIRAIVEVPVVKGAADRG